MKVSVITAYYYGNQYINDYIRMLNRNANYIGDNDSIEVIIVNDSPDDHLSIDRLRGILGDRLSDKISLNLITNDKNMGIHASRVRGLKASTGEYIIFLDQDDLLSKYAIKTYIDNATANKEVLVSNAIIGTREGYLKWYRSDYQTDRIGDIDCYIDIGTQIISPGHTCINQEAIPSEWSEYICTNNGADDYFLWLLMLNDGVEFKYIDKPLYLHSYTGENLSADTTVTDESTYEFCDYLDAIAHFPDDYVKRLRRMVEYKAQFRESSYVDKVKTSLNNLDILLPNIEYKIKSRTPLGFNR